MPEEELTAEDDDYTLQDPCLDGGAIRGWVVASAIQFAVAAVLCGVWLVLS